MLIDRNTKISKLLKFNPDALEAIIAINPMFSKLRNPVLRKLMAGRTSIAMAAKVGSNTPADFFAALKPLGFYSDSNEKIETEASEANDAPFDINPDNVTTMDVRPILAGGEDPLTQILAKVKELEPGQVLKIINTFEPSPLIAMLNKKGYGSYVNKIAKNHIETFFLKKADAYPTEVKSPKLNFDGWQEALDRFEGKTETIDVRNLEMPLPMTTILEALEVLPAEKALFVYHKKVPVYLLPELSERNLEFRIKEISENEYRLLIFKK